MFQLIHVQFAKNLYALIVFARAKAVRGIVVVFVQENIILMKISSYAINAIPPSNSPFPIHLLSYILSQ